METENTTVAQADIPSKQQTPAEVLDLANQVGGFIQYWGFKNVHGRIWTHLFLSSEPLDAGTLVKRLNVSKALISMSLKELLKYRVVRLCGRSEENTQLYDVNGDITGVILNVLRNRETRILDKVTRSFQTLEKFTNEDREHWKISARRIEVLGDLIETGRQTLDGLLALKEMDHALWGRFQSIDC